MRSAVWFTAGIVVGAALGWGAAWSARDASPSPAEDRSRPAADVEPSRRASRTSRPVEAAPPSEPSRAAASASQAIVDRATVFETGSAVQIFAEAQGDPRITAAETSILLARLDAALAARDDRLVWTILDVLGRSGVPAADARLVSMLGDGAAELPRAFVSTARSEWFKNAPVAGVAAAARRRLDADAAKGGGGRDAESLAALAYRHGGADDLRWVEDVAVGTGGVGFQFRRAIASTARPETADAVERLAERGLAGHLLEEFARSCPQAAFETASRWIRAADSGLQVAPRLDEGELMKALGTSVDASRADAARDLLLSLSSQRLRVAANAAIQAMADRGLDVAPFATLLSAPLDVLRAPDRDPQLVTSSIYCVEYHRLMWTEDAAVALDLVAASGRAESEHAGNVAKLVRAEAAKKSGK